MTDTVASLSVRVGADTTEAKQKLRELERLGGAFGRTISGAFADAVFSGDGLSTTLRSLALDMSRLALRSAFQPLTGAIGNGLASLAGGLTPFAKGGVVGTPMPKPFAQGGVVASPVTFPMGGGRMGLAGEAGPEAIMPLARGADGRRRHYGHDEHLDARRRGLPPLRNPDRRDAVARRQPRATEYVVGL